MRITITITGAHGVGKTTLLNALTPILELMGFRRRGGGQFYDGIEHHNVDGEPAETLRFDLLEGDQARGERNVGAAHFRRLNRHLVSEVGDD
ncbi:MAG: hypothetical protein DCC73_11490 [Proteobacteria bacterium]|nr:MAG: hypothetical protein DCC73_11490 [Pseudomonadota bacterium]